MYIFHAKACQNRITPFLLLFLLIIIVPHWVSKSIYSKSHEANGECNLFGLSITHILNEMLNVIWNEFIQWTTINGFVLSWGWTERERETEFSTRWTVVFDRSVPQSNCVLNYHAFLSALPFHICVNWTDDNNKRMNMRKQQYLLGMRGTACRLKYNSCSVIGPYFSIVSLAFFFVVIFILCCVLLFRFFFRFSPNAKCVEPFSRH